jgi:hypothetical protein
MGIIVLYHPGGRDRLAHGTTYETEPVETWMSLDELQRRYGSDFASDPPLPRGEGDTE